MAGDARAAPVVVFAAIALSALGGITAVVCFTLKSDGMWRFEHIAGAILWMSATFVVHTMTLLAYARIHRYHDMYTESAAVYAVLSILFVALFVADHPAAAAVQWVILAPMAFMFAINITIGFRLLRFSSDAVAA